jgi:hypothetical protein
VFINPSDAQRQSLGSNVRGIIDDKGDDYAWAAEFANHQDIERALGISSSEYYGGDEGEYML